MTRTRWLFSFATRAVFIGNLGLGTVGFLLFLNWYDTGKFDSSGWYIAAIGGTFWGSLALIIEVWLYNRYKFWPNNRLVFFMRVIALSILCITLGFSTGSGLYSAISQITSGASFLTILSALILIPIVGVFYLLMIVPFGVLIGLVNGLLLQFSHAFEPGRP